MGIFSRLFRKGLSIEGNYSKLKDGMSLHLIKSMAVPWREIKEDLKGYIPVMFEHLVKLYYYHDFDEYLWNWCDSVKKGFEAVPKVKGKNKFPAEGQIYNFIWDERFSQDPDPYHKSYAQEINFKYKDVPKIPIENLDYKGFNEFLKAYLKLAAKLISENGSVNAADVLNFVKGWNYGFSLKE